VVRDPPPPIKTAKMASPVNNKRKAENDVPEDGKQPAAKLVKREDRLAEIESLMATLAEHLAPLEQQKLALQEEQCRLVCEQQEEKRAAEKEANEEKRAAEKEANEKKHVAMVNAAKQEGAIVVSSCSSKEYSMILPKDGRWSWSDRPAADLNDPEQLCSDLDRAFFFTGRGPEVLTVEGGTPQDVYNAVYSTKVPRKHRFVFTTFCNCNMGNCGALLRMDVCKEPTTTYGQVFKMLGHRNTPDVLKEGDFYEYPGLMIGFNLSPVTKFPDYFYENCGAYGDRGATPCDISAGDGHSYIEWYFSR